MKCEVKKITMLLTGLLVLLAASAAFASGSGMPYESGLNKVVTSVTGPMAKGLGILAIFGCAIGNAWGEGGSGFKKMMQIGLWLSIAFAATSWGLPFLGFGGGAAF